MTDNPRSNTNQYDPVDETPTPRKRGGRPRGSRISYAARCRELQQRHRHARELLLEAADADPAVCKALLNVALRTLSEE